MSTGNLQSRRLAGRQELERPVVERGVFLAMGLDTNMDIDGYMCLEGDMCVL